MGFIPIVHFKNEGDETEEFGISDPAIEPFMKAYHDVMMHAIQDPRCQHAEAETAIERCCCLFAE